jgi:hypothetical protein
MFDTKLCCCCIFACSCCGFELGAKIRTQRVWVLVLFFQPNNLWIWVQVLVVILCASLGSLKHAPDATRLPSLIDTLATVNGQCHGSISGF